MIRSLYGVHAAADNVGALRFLAFAGGGPMMAAGAVSAIVGGCNPSCVAEKSSSAGEDVGGSSGIGTNGTSDPVLRAESPRAAPSCEAEGLSL